MVEEARIFAFAKLDADRRADLIDDQLRESSWEQELYCLGVPPSMQAEFFSVEEAREAYPGWKEDGAHRVLLVRDVPTLERLAAGGLLSGEEVNLGGIHSGPGRTRVIFINTPPSF